MYTERQLTLNAVLWSKYFMFKNVVWFPYISSCGLQLDENPFNASIVPNYNVRLLLTTQLQRPVNMSLLWGKTWMFCPGHVDMHSLVPVHTLCSYFLLNHILNSRCLKICQGLAVTCWFFFESMWSSSHRWWTVAGVREWYYVC